MPTRKIRDVEEFRTCTDPEHNPPSMMVFQPGVYEHECPRCGRKIEFTVRSKYMMSCELFPKVSLDTAYNSNAPDWPLVKR